jgi:hypothetical protein
VVWAGVDVSGWFGGVPEGCDTPSWVPFMTPDELNTDGPKLTLDSSDPDCWFESRPKRLSLERQSTEGHLESPTATRARVTALPNEVVPVR